MARKRREALIDPATGKPLPDGVTYRGPLQYRARRLVNGRRTTKTFTKASSAVRWLAEIEVDYRRGLFVDRTKAERNTLGDVIRRYQDEVLGEDSYKRGAEKERGHLNVVLEDEICRLRMASLTSADVAKFRDRMRDLQYASATIVRRLNLIQTVIQHARREWEIHLTENAAQMVKRPPGADRKRNRVFGGHVVADRSNHIDSVKAVQADRSEKQRLLAACDADTNKLLGSIVRFAIYTAMRQGEIVGLHWGNIDLEKRTAIVRGSANNVTKNGEVREVPLLPDAVELLLRLGPGEGRVFPIEQNILKMRFRRAVGRAGIIDLTFHDLRHIATSRLALVYPNPLDLKRVTGHKDLKSLDRYYHATAEQLAARADKTYIARPIERRMRRATRAATVQVS
jgi:integrase